ncbi:MAG: Hsp70 family protein [Terracidiphilus sp.]|nr:Hsp70 family protein [Terracidiphilus sp.]
MRANAFSADAIGIDFGTTNSSIALASASGEVRMVPFSFAGALSPSFRSVLYFEMMRPSRRTHSLTGPAAIERYLEADEKGRLVQSLKSHLASHLFDGTVFYSRRYSIEEMVAAMLKDLRLAAEAHFKRPIRSATVGRPVRFESSETDEDDAYAESRLRKAFTMAGFEKVDFEFEPVAAACAYEATLDRDELILIGDFGGGTSDFSLLRVGPTVLRRGRTPEDLLGNGGVGLAGDAFDARIVRKLVSPELGSDSEVISFHKRLPAVPAWIYANLERWHYLSFLRTRNVREMLKGVLVRALEPNKIEALIALIEEDLGYPLYQAVQEVKYELSRSESAEFRFNEGSLDLRARVTRAEFESWIEPDLQRLEKAVDTLLENCGVAPAKVDRVFLTGGTSFVPAVRRIFTSRFGEERIRTGNAFTSVAHGLALRALQRA